MRTLLRIFFHHFYHNLAWTYDSIAALVSVGRWRDWGLASLPYLQGPAILEVGFGTGHLQVKLNQLAFHTFGLDESMQMVALAQANLTRNELTHKLSRGKAQNLPFLSQSFDNIVANFPSEYILNSETLTEIWRVLKPSGRLVITPMAWIGGRSLPDRIAKWLFRLTGQTGESVASLPSRFQNALINSGFQVETVSIEIRHSTVIILIAKKTN